MARKVFISILGTGYYNRTKYYWEDQKTFVETRFIQEATLKLLAEDWTENDIAFFFLTKAAEATNWNSPAQKDDWQVKRGERDTYRGLQERIMAYRFPFRLFHKPISNGNNEKEIWEIFETVYSVLENGDELYFDITHAFRSIPMLVMVLINYAKFLKDINVKRITYGNWEGRDTETNIAPIIDLTSFSSLQDWTSAANDLVNFGNADKLVELTKRDIRPFAREFRGENETINSLNKINKNLPHFISNIQTCRGKAIIKNEEGLIINKELGNIKENFITPLNPILNKIKEKVSAFSETDNLLNGFNAVKWCIDNNLYQQGFTILQENIISLVCKEIDSDSDNLVNRNIINSCFKIKNDKIKEKDWKGDAKNNYKITRSVLSKSKLIDDMKSEFTNISNIRNDINHMGYRDNPINHKRIKSLLEYYFNNVLGKIQ